MYSIIDLHCDTLYALSKGTLAGTLLTNTLHVDRERMEKGGSITSCYAIFGDTDEFSSPWQAACDLHELFLSPWKSTAIGYDRYVLSMIF